MPVLQECVLAFQVSQLLLAMQQMHFPTRLPSSVHVHQGRVMKNAALVEK